MPTTDEKSTLALPLRNFSVSVRTFWSMPTVSPLLRSSNSWKERRSVWRRPSLKICTPKRCTTMRSR